jgi:hypothetical protein
MMTKSKPDVTSAKSKNEVGQSVETDRIAVHNPTPEDLEKTQSQVAPNTRKETLTGLAKAWAALLFFGNLAAACAPASYLSDSSLGGVAFMVMLLSAATAGGYILLYYKNHIGLYMILGANILGIFMNSIEVSGYSISVTTGFVAGIITYFVTRKQIDYPFWKPQVTEQK